MILLQAPLLTPLHTHTTPNTQALRARQHSRVASARPARLQQDAQGKCATREGGRRRNEEAERGHHQSCAAAACLLLSPHAFPPSHHPIPQAQRSTESRYIGTSLWEGCGMAGCACVSAFGRAFPCSKPPPSFGLKDRSPFSQSLLHPTHRRRRRRGPAAQGHGGRVEAVPHRGGAAGHGDGTWGVRVEGEGPGGLGEKGAERVKGRREQGQCLPVKACASCNISSVALSRRRSCLSLPRSLWQRRRCMTPASNLILPLFPSPSHTHTGANRVDAGRRWRQSA